MNAVPRRREFAPERPFKFVVGDEPGSFWIECEVVSPPSAVGRTVDVYLDPDAALAVLKAARRAAVRARAKHEGMESHGL